MKQNKWAQFDPQVYLANNYRRLHEEDRMIIKILADFYRKIPKLQLTCEVGVGPNLYPIIALLPISKKVVAIDYSLKNIAYLTSQKKQVDTFWGPYLNLFQKESKQYKIDLLQNLKKKLVIEMGCVYTLPKGVYDLSSMHFCAESITDDKKKFYDACLRFMVSVKRGGYLAASFMENSGGYRVGGVSYPAYPVNRHILEQVFTPFVKKLEIHRIPKAKNALRKGYTGMLVLTARRK